MKASSIKSVLMPRLPRRLYLELKWRDFKSSNPRMYENLQRKRRIVTSTSYSLKPFDDTKSIFIHIPKCAGVSVNRTLYGNLAGGHRTFEQYLGAFEPRNVLDYFKFTIVRNPWDRLVSAFHFLREGGFSEKDRALAESEFSAYSDFDAFVREWLSPENLWKFPHFTPQHHFILERQRKIKLDYIGLFENLEADFSDIARRIGIDGKLEGSNRSSHRNYRDYYTEETKAFVAGVYAEDIALFGYEFNNASLPAQLAARERGTWAQEVL